MPSYPWPVGKINKLVKALVAKHAISARDISLELNIREYVIEIWAYLREYHSFAFWAE